MRSVIMTGLVCLASVATAEPPKPPAELKQLDWLEGKWVCEGTQKASPMGPEHTFVNKLDIAFDNAGFWEHFRLEQDKPMKGFSPDRGAVGWEPQTRKLVRNDYMAGGLLIAFSSPGWQGDTIVFDGEGRGAGKPMPWRHTMTKLGAARFKSVFEMAGAPFIEETCARVDARGKRR